MSRPQAAVGEDTRYAWRTLSVTSLGAALQGVNTSTLSVALPVVARHFSASATQANWILLSYLLVNAVMILSFGRLADLVGRRRLYLMGLSVLTLASLGSGFAPSANALVVLRAVQAIGAAAIITNSAALLTDSFPRRLLSVGLGLQITTAAAAQVTGPVLGGALATWFGWRAVFLFNVPIGLAGLLWGAQVLRALPVQRQPEGFDVVGSLLSLLALGGVVVALSEGGALGWRSMPVRLGVTTAVIGLPAFVLVQMRRRHPLVDPRLFSDRERAMAYLSTFLLSVARYAVVVLISLFLQAADNLDSFHAGLRVVPVPLGLMIGAPVSGRLVQHYSTRLLSTSGLVCCAAGLGLLAGVLDVRTPLWLIEAALGLVGIGGGVFLTPNTSSIMASVGDDRRGIANGVRSMLQNTGNTVGTAMTLAIVTARLGPAEKSAAYGGRLSHLPGHDLDRFVAGYHVALLVLCVLCFVAGFASLVRGQSRGYLSAPGKMLAATLS